MADTALWWFKGEELFLRAGDITWAITALGSQMVRIRVNPGQEWSQPETGHQSWSVMAADDTMIRFASPGLVGQFSFSEARFIWETPEGHLLDQDAAPMSIQADSQMIKSRLYNHYLGGGESTLPVDKRYAKVIFWNRDAAEIHTEFSSSLYQSHPIWWGWSNGHVWGTYVDTGAWVSADFNDSAGVAIQVNSQTFTYYGIYDTTLDGALSRLSRLTGRMPLPPLWALGHHISRWSYQSAQEVLSVAQELRQRQIPCDAIYLDIDYMDGYRIMTWNPDTFRDPQSMIDALHAINFHLVAIVDPGIKVDPQYSLYRSAIDNGMLVTMSDGTVVQGQVWPGESVFPDFFQDKVVDWWASQISQFVSSGVDGIWNDMNEPSLFNTDGHTLPDDAVHKPSDIAISHRQVHNYYGREMARASYQGLLMHDPDIRPFLLSRAGFSGMQQWTAVWTGDNHSLFSALRQMVPMLLSLGLSGQAFAGADVGGFQGDANAELFAKWVAAAVLTPFFRNHSAMGTARQEPWSFGPEVEQQVRHLISWRYRLLPTLYQLFWEAHRIGRPVMRPMLYHYPPADGNDILEDQFLIGPHLLVAPILDVSVQHRAAWIPDGTWYALETGQPYEGPGYIVLHWPMGQLPALVKDNSILFLQTAETSALPLPTRIQWSIRVSQTTEATWYQDDGVSMRYHEGQYNQLDILVSSEAERCIIVTTAKHHGFSSPTAMLDIWVHDPSGRFRQLVVNGMGLDFIRHQNILMSSVPTAWIWQTSETG